VRIRNHKTGRNTMAENPDDFIEVYDPAAFDGCLPAEVPVRGLDGEIIVGAVAKVTKDAEGLSVSITMPATRQATGHVPDRP
jgi:phage head maturation protease